MLQNLKLTGLIIVLAGVLAGCRNCAVVYGDGCRELMTSKMDARQIRGEYSFKEVKVSDQTTWLFGDMISQRMAERLKHDLCRDAPQAFDAARTNGVPVSISVIKTKADVDDSILAKVNNVLSVCTLTIWPWYDATEYTYQIVVNAEDVKATRKYTLVERDFSSILPLGYIPVPAFADKRNATKGGLDSELEPTILRKGVESAFIAEQKR